MQKNTYEKYWFHDYTIVDFGLENKADCLHPQFVETNKDGDTIIESENVKLIVDGKSLFYLMGTELDFSDGLNGKGFLFNNPNATKTCGCGESFGV